MQYLDVDAQQHIVQQLGETAKAFTELASQAGAIAQIVEALAERMRSGGKIMFCGNGGSAADAQHLAAELLGRYLLDRRALPALALTTDTSALTAIANDYDFAQVFARQIEGLGRSGDALVAISTSGNSANVVAAIETAKRRGILTIGLVNSDGGRVGQIADLCIRVPARHVPRVQELQIAVGHLICELLEKNLSHD